MHGSHLSQSPAGPCSPGGARLRLDTMLDLQRGVLEVFVEAQALARDITTEKEGNVRAAYLLMKQADNAEQWANTRSNKRKLTARNKRRRDNYNPAKRREEYLRTGK